MDVLKQYGQLSGGDWNFGWGAKAGIRFLEDIYLYHPGISYFYNNSKEDINFNYLYGTKPGEVKHSIQGISFDNYIRLSYDKPSSITTQHKQFVILGIKAGTISSTYNMDGLLDSLSVKDDGEVYGATLAYLTESDLGLGFIFALTYLYSTEQSIEGIFQTKFGLRYTF